MAISNLTQLRISRNPRMDYILFFKSFFFNFDCIIKISKHVENMTLLNKIWNLHFSFYFGVNFFFQLIFNIFNPS